MCCLGSKKRYKNKRPTSFGCRFVGALEGTRRLCLRQILPGLAWGARLLQLKTVYHTVFYTLQPSRVLVPHHNKHKSQHPNGYWLLWCAGRDSPSLPAANTAWPCLGRKALAAKNSVPHCFLHAATLSGSRPSS